MSQAAVSHNTAPLDGDPTEIVLSAVKEISHIATLPEITMKIIRLVEDPDSTAQDLNNLIANDPALGARILKVVNSAFYGLPGQIGSTNRAIVLLGLNAVKNIAIAASLSKLFRGGQICPAFDAKDLWIHSIAVATATRMLSAKAGLGLPDEAFLAGLIHDIGIMVEIQVRRVKFVEAMELKQKNPGMTLREAEEATIGANHEHFGAALCKLWKFPSSFAYVTGWHHRPLDLPVPNRGLTSLVHVADIMVAKRELGITVSVESTEVSHELLQGLNLTNEDLDAIDAKLPEALEEAMNLLQEGV